jgi:hypothetical protein
MAIQLELPFKEYQMEKNKYHMINDRFFGFEIFEDIFKAIKSMEHSEHDMFNAGLASAEGAVRRLREQYYESIKKMYAQEDND